MILIRYEIYGIEWVVSPYELGDKGSDLFHRRNINISILTGDIDDETYMYLYQSDKKLYYYHDGLAEITHNIHWTENEEVTEMKIEFEEFCNLIKENEKYI